MRALNVVEERQERLTFRLLVSVGHEAHVAQKEAQMPSGVGSRGEILLLTRILVSGWQAPEEPRVIVDRRHEQLLAAFLLLTELLQYLAGDDPDRAACRFTSFAN
jgi:hypothetical protein